MKKSFDLLVKLNIEDLKSLKNPKVSPDLQAFLTQFGTEWKAEIFANHDPIKLAENWLREVRALVKEGQPGIDQNSREKIEIIYELYNGMGKHAFRLYDMMNTLDTILMEIKEAKNIKKIVLEYKEHLEQKMQNQRVDASSELSPIQQKLKTRYDTISSLYSTIKDKTLFDESDNKAIKEAVTTCLDNKPEWTERPFLQKLTDILSFGFKALYRAFFSKEARLEGQLEQLTPSPKVGG